MVMNLFSGKEASVAELVSKKKYAQAADLLKSQIEKRPNDTQLRIQLADVLAKDNKITAAVAIMDEVATQFANDGFTTKAVAALKKIEKLDPSRDISAKLRELVKDMEPAPPPRHSGAIPAVQPEPAFGLDTTGFIDTEASAPADEPAPVAAAPAPMPVPQVRRQPTGMAASPLFASFPEEELLEILEGFELLSFEPGDIVMTEGEEGDSVFVIASGFLRAWVRTAKGTSVRVSEMHEGDFFGEIALLTHKPRSATVIAAAHSELLELDRATLDAIAQRRPHVRKVILDVYNARTDNTTENMLRGIDIQEVVAEAIPEEAVVVVEPTPVEDPVVALKDNAIAATRASNFERAFELWNEVLAKSPDDRHALNALGLASAKLLRWDATASAFERLLKQTPEDPGAHFSLGFAYWKLNRNDEAKVEFRKTLAIKPDHPKAQQALAKLGG